MQAASSSKPHEGGVTPQRNAASSTQGQKALVPAPVVLTSNTQAPRNDEPAGKGGEEPKWAEWGLVLVTAILAWFTYRLWKSTSDMVKRADVNTASQLGMMEGQLAAMQQQGAAASQTLDQIRREFAVAHRPKVRLRRIYFAGSTKDFVPIRTPDGAGGYTETPSPTKTPATVIIEMAHVDGVGVANAVLRVTFKIFNTDQPIPWEIQDELASADPQKMQISQSGSGVLLVKVPAVAALFSDSGVLSGSQTVYCVGYAEYSDGSGELTGRTGFIRRCDIRNWWFLPDHSPGGANFEYAD